MDDSQQFYSLEQVTNSDAFKAMDPKSKRIVMANWVKKQPDIGDYSDEDIAAMTNKLQSLYPDAPKTPAPTPQAQPPAQPKTSDYAPGALAGGITAGAQQTQQPPQPQQQDTGDAFSSALSDVQKGLSNTLMGDMVDHREMTSYMHVDPAMQRAAENVRSKYLVGNQDNAVASLADDLSRLPLWQRISHASKSGMAQPTQIAVLQEAYRRNPTLMQTPSIQQMNAANMADLGIQNVPNPNNQKGTQPATVQNVKSTGIANAVEFNKYQRGRAQRQEIDDSWNPLTKLTYGVGDILSALPGNDVYDPTPITPSGAIINALTGQPGSSEQVEKMSQTEKLNPFNATVYGLFNMMTDPSMYATLGLGGMAAKALGSVFGPSAEVLAHKAMMTGFTADALYNAKQLYDEGRTNAAIGEIGTALAPFVVHYGLKGFEGKLSQKTIDELQKASATRKPISDEANAELQTAGVPDGTINTGDIAQNATDALITNSTNNGFFLDKTSTNPNGSQTITMTHPDGTSVEINKAPSEPKPNIGEAQPAPDTQPVATDAEGKPVENPTQNPTSSIQVRLSANPNPDIKPGLMSWLDNLAKIATSGDKPRAKKAALELHNHTVNAIEHFIGGTGATVEHMFTTGLYDEYPEPSTSMKITFDPSRANDVIAGLDHFADVFRQKEYHIMAEPENSDPNHVYDDGSRNTIVYNVKFDPEKFTPGKLAEMAKDAGLDGITVGKNNAEFYYTGEPNEAGITRFTNAAKSFIQNVGGSRPVFEGDVSRLWRRGVGVEGLQGTNGGTFSPASAENPNPIARTIAERLKGGPVEPYPQSKKITPEQAALQTKIANDYANMPMNDLSTPHVKEAYKALAKAVKEQYKNIGVKVELWDPSKGEPYKNSAEMRKDVRDNHHLYIYGTDAGSFGPEGIDYTGHPLLEKTRYKDINGKPLLVNDLFRAVHDYYAHTIEPVQFGPLGEEAAWQNHMRMTKDPMARWALSSETRGQNSYVNFGPDAEYNKANPHDTKFAPQKVGLLPVEDVMTGDSKLDNELIQAAKERGISTNNAESVRDNMAQNEQPNIPKQNKKIGVVEQRPSGLFNPGTEEPPRPLNKGENIRGNVGEDAEPGNYAYRGKTKETADRASVYKVEPLNEDGSTMSGKRKTINLTKKEFIKAFNFDPDEDFTPRRQTTENNVDLPQGDDRTQTGVTADIRKGAANERAATEGQEPIDHSGGQTDKEREAEGRAWVNNKANNLDALIAKATKGEPLTNTERNALMVAVADIVHDTQRFYENATDRMSKSFQDKYAKMVERRRIIDNAWQKAQSESGASLRLSGLRERQLAEAVRTFNAKKVIDIINGDNISKGIRPLTESSKTDIISNNNLVEKLETALKTKQYEGVDEFMRQFRRSEAIARREAIQTDIKNSVAERTYAKQQELAQRQQEWEDLVKQLKDRQGPLSKRNSLNVGLGGEIGELIVKMAKNLIQRGVIKSDILITKLHETTGVAAVEIAKYLANAAMEFEQNVTTRRVNETEEQYWNRHRQALSDRAAELQKYLDTGEKPASKKTEPRFTNTPADIQEARQRVADLQKQVNEKYNAPKTAEEKAQDNLKRQIDTLNKHLEDGTFPETKGKPVTSDAIEELKKQRDALQDELENRRQQTPEYKANEQRKNEADVRAELERQLNAAYDEIADRQNPNKQGVSQFEKAKPEKSVTEDILDKKLDNEPQDITDLKSKLREARDNIQSLVESGKSTQAELDARATELDKMRADLNKKLEEVGKPKPEKNKPTDIPQDIKDLQKKLEDARKADRDSKKTTVDPEVKARQNIEDQIDKYTQHINDGTYPAKTTKRTIPEQRQALIDKRNKLVEILNARRQSEPSYIENKKISSLENELNRRLAEIDDRENGTSVKPTSSKTDITQPSPDDSPEVKALKEKIADADANLTRLKQQGKLNERQRTAQSEKVGKLKAKIEAENEAREKGTPRPPTNNPKAKSTGEVQFLEDQLRRARIKRDIAIQNAQNPSAANTNFQRFRTYLVSGLSSIAKVGGYAAGQAIARPPQWVLAHVYANVFPELGKMALTEKPGTMDALMHVVFNTPIIDNFTRLVDEFYNDVDYRALSKSEIINAILGDVPDYAGFLDRFNIGHVNEAHGYKPSNNAVVGTVDRLAQAAVNTHPLIKLPIRRGDLFARLIDLRQEMRQYLTEDELNNPQVMKALVEQANNKSMRNTLTNSNLLSDMVSGFAKSQEELHPTLSTFIRSLNPVPRVAGNIAGNAMLTVFGLPEGARRAIYAKLGAEVPEGRKPSWQNGWIKGTLPEGLNEAQKNALLSGNTRFPVPEGLDKKNTNIWLTGDTRLPVPEGLSKEQTKAWLSGNTKELPVPKGLDEKQTNAWLSGNTKTHPVPEGLNEAQKKAWLSGNTRTLPVPDSIEPGSDNWFRWKLSGKYTPAQADGIMLALKKGGFGALMLTLMLYNRIMHTDIPVLRGTGFADPDDPKKIGERPDETYVYGHKLPTFFGHMPELVATQTLQEAIDAHDKWAEKPADERTQAQWASDMFGSLVSSSMHTFEHAPIFNPAIQTGKIFTQSDHNGAQNVIEWASQMAANAMIPQLIQGVARGYDQQNGYPRPVYQDTPLEVAEEKLPYFRGRLDTRPTPMRNYIDKNDPVVNELNRLGYTLNKTPKNSLYDDKTKNWNRDKLAALEDAKSDQIHDAVFKLLNGIGNKQQTEQYKAMPDFAPKGQHSKFETLDTIITAAQKRATKSAGNLTGVK